MKNIKFYFVGFLMCISLIQCERFEHKPVVHGVKPKAITITSVSNYAGHSTIHFVVTDFENTQSILAVYLPDSAGKVFKRKVSKFVDSITVEGFPMEGKYNVELYAVGYSNKRSDPVTIQVDPLVPSYVSSLKSLKISPIFGGIVVSGNNENKSKLTITILNEDSIIDRHFTKLDHFKYFIFNMEHKLYHLKAFIRNRWLNTSDTITVDVEPYFEKRITFNYYPFKLPGDAFGGVSGWDVPNLFDGSILPPEAGGPACYFCHNPSTFPVWFSVDLRKKHVLSRIKIYPRWSLDVYSGGNPKKLRFWGSNNPNPNGDLDSTWTSLGGTFTVKKPSGLPLGQHTQEDLEQCKEGWNFRFNEPTLPFQYIRIEVLEPFNAQFVAMVEVQLYGT